MSRRHSVRFAAGLGSALLSCASVGRNHQTIFRGAVDVVSVPVSVTTGPGIPVTDLTAADFIIADNGVWQAIDLAPLEQVPLDLTIVLTSFPPDRGLDHYRGVLDAYAVRAVIRATDRVRVVSIRDDVRSVYLTPGEPLPLESETYFMGLSLVDGLFYALAWPVPADRRHLVVAFTDGWDTCSTLELDRLPDLAARAGTVVHVVFWASPGDGNPSGGGVRVLSPKGGSPGKSTDSPAWAASYRVIRDVALQTGGTVRSARESPSALAAIVADFRTSYVLRYRPRGVPLSGWHDIDVRVTRPGKYTVRARKGYHGD